MPTTYVFIDTCALLDVFRLPAKKGDASANLLREYNSLLQKVQNGDVVIVSSYMTYVEEQSNLKKAKTTEADWENSLSNNIEIFENFALEAGLITDHILLNPFASINIKKYVEDLYNALVRKAFYLPEKLQYDKFAMARVLSKTPPAHKKTEYKDCFIWATCIDLAKQVKSNDKIVFYTTNTEDFTIDSHHSEALRFQRDASNVIIYTDFCQLMHNI